MVTEQIDSISSSISREALDEACSKVISTAKNRGHTDAINEAFDVLDLSQTGSLNRCDVQAFMQAAARRTKLDVQDVNSSVIEAAVDALIHDAAGGGRSGGDDGGVINSLTSTSSNSVMNLITREQFHLMFDRHPDMLAVFEDSMTTSARRQSAISHMSIMEELEEEELENEQIWMHDLITHWNNRWTALVWIVIYIAANVAVFTVKAIKYARNDEAMAVFGNCIVVARGCAAALNLNACLVLLAMCKTFMTLLRKTPLRFCFPFDAIQEAHIMIGIVFALFAASHTAAHICDFHRFSTADEADIYALFGDRVDPPESPAGRWAYMLSTRAGITGIIMVVCLVTAYSFAFNRRKNFNKFWYTHHLLLVMLVALCIHGTGNLLEPYQSLFWVIGPLTLYALPRIWRETPLSALDIVKVEVKKGDVVQLRLKKPKHYFQRVERAGMYGVLNIPSISRTEWHPFTLTSAPSDEYIEFHFRRVGKWTGKVHDLLAAKVDDSQPSGIKEAPVVKFEGPIGASSQGFSEYSVIVLIGAGIGILPWYPFSNSFLQTLEKFAAVSSIGLSEIETPLFGLQTSWMRFLTLTRRMYFRSGTS
mmetsp:Transcript_15135/g.32858  ORF Transcript_15135/g.32858 Transcript_15135/m.32858 type:complete len:592 (-) Transcript_15135:397-2172(-)